MVGSQCLTSLQNMTAMVTQGNTVDFGRYWSDPGCFGYVHHRLTAAPVMRNRYWGKNEGAQTGVSDWWHFPACSQTDCWESHYGVLKGGDLTCDDLTYDDPSYDDPCCDGLSCDHRTCGDLSYDDPVRRDSHRHIKVPVVGEFVVAVWVATMRASAATAAFAATAERVSSCSPAVAPAAAETQATSVVVDSTIASVVAELSADRSSIIEADCLMKSVIVIIYLLVYLLALPGHFVMRAYQIPFRT